MMAEAAKLTGRPGVCFVTHGPGATNFFGVHVAMQDSTPLVLLVGQAARGVLGREAFPGTRLSRGRWRPRGNGRPRSTTPIVCRVLSRAFHAQRTAAPAPLSLRCLRTCLRT